MREILFRAKRADSGTWIEGNYLNDEEIAYISGFIYNDTIFGFEKIPFKCQVIPETVSQFTGLYDKNGVRIFEGDVLKMEIKSNYINPLQAPLVFIGVCNFKDGAFGFSKQRAGIEEFTAFSSTTYNVEFEVIGNRFDNPDLLN